MIGSCKKTGFPINEFLPESEKRRLKKRKEERDAWLVKKLGWVGKILVFVDDLPKPDHPWIIY